MRRPDQGQRFKRSMYASGCPVYCCYCAEVVPEEEATVEHVVPRAWGGSDRRSNLLIACEPCNKAVGRDSLLTHKSSPEYRQRQRKRKRQRYKRRKQAAQEIANRLRELFREMGLEKQS